jgi:hypothetical protein
LSYLPTPEASGVGRYDKIDEYTNDQVTSAFQIIFRDANETIGWHLKIPMLDAMDQVQVTMQTDKVVDIPVR